MKRLLLLVTALIIYGSLYPWQFEWWRSSESPWSVMLRGWPDHFDRWLWRDVVINVLLYAPLGLTAFLAVARRHSRLLAASAAMLLGVGLSTGMEIAQVYVPGRVSSLLDVVTNTTGTLAGVVAALALGSRIEALASRRSRNAGNGAMLLLGCWVISQLYPFFPALTHTQLQRSLAALAKGLPLSPLEVWTIGAEWLAVLLALQAVVGRVRWWWPAGAVLLAVPRFVIAARTVTPNELAGALFGWLLWLAIPREWRLRAGVWAMASAIALRELAPFHFSAAAQPFHWIPFAATLESERFTAVVILAQKVFDYGVMVWLLRKSGVSYWRAGTCVAAGLFFFELAQIYLPGRTPELTDSVAAGLMAVTLWLCDRGEGSAGDQIAGAAG